MRKLDKRSERRERSSLSINNMPFFLKKKKIEEKPKKIKDHYPPATRGASDEREGGGGVGVPTEGGAPKKPSEVASEIPPKKVKEKRISDAYKILKTPHVTEKATDLTKKNQYVFKVYPKANKVEIKKAIEDIYGVDVISVKIINIPSKRRKLGKIMGWRKGYKKTIVKIKEGQKIEVLPR